MKINSLLKKRNLPFFILLPILLYFGDFPAFSVPKEKMLEITSQPSGADVYVNSVKIGLTPQNISLNTKQRYRIMVYKTGFEVFEKEIDPQQKTAGDSNRIKLEVKLIEANTP